MSIVTVVAIRAVCVRGLCAQAIDLLANAIRLILILILVLILILILVLIQIVVVVVVGTHVVGLSHRQRLRFTASARSW